MAMGSVGFWIAYCIGFGILGGGLYTYMSGRKKNRWSLFVRSAIIYTIFALAFVWLLYRIA